MVPLLLLLYLCRHLLLLLLSPYRVDLEPIFEFLDDDGDQEINLTELMALSVIGDANGKECTVIKDSIAM